MNYTTNVTALFIPITQLFPPLESFNDLGLSMPRDRRRPHKKTSKRSNAKVVRVVTETVTYPRLEVTAYYNPCLSSNTSCEHVLKCGHCIVTALPNQPCGGNCLHVDSTAGTKANRQGVIKKTDLDFWCDACVEEGIEMEIETHHGRTLDARDADQRRTAIRLLRAQTAKQAKESFQKCYIAAKTVSVRCDLDGLPLKGYLCTPSTHPFDTAIPPAGANMFEDVDPSIPAEPLEQLSSNHRSVISHSKKRKGLVTAPHPTAAIKTSSGRTNSRRCVAEPKGNPGDTISAHRAVRLKTRLSRLVTSTISPLPSSSLHAAAESLTAAAQALTTSIPSNQTKRLHFDDDSDYSPPQKRKHEPATIVVSSDSDSDCVPTRKRMRRATRASRSLR
jgi:hypothetical protein